MDENLVFGIVALKIRLYGTQAWQYIIDQTLLAV